MRHKTKPLQRPMTASLTACRSRQGRAFGAPRSGSSLDPIGVRRRILRQGREGMKCVGVRS